MRNLVLVLMGLVLCTCQSQKILPLLSPSDFKAQKFYVFSDPHVYFPEAMGVVGEEYKAVLDVPSKRILQSPYILGKNIENILREKPDYVLITGDLTSEGETLNHLELAKRLRTILDHGIRVFVVPGNHDLNNPAAAVYEHKTKSMAKSPNETEFANIYADYGYNGSLLRDPDSASYLAAINDKLYLLAIDSTYSEDNYALGHEHTGGRLSEKTYAFLETALKKARADGAFVIAMQHHGLIPHYKLQDVYLKDYLVENFEREITLFKTYGVSYTFTGHAHSQDISARGSIYDIETGSGVTNPYPFRLLELGADLSLTVTSGEIVPSDKTLEEDRTWIAANTGPIIESRLIGFGFDKAVAKRLSVAGVERLLAQYAGDEGRMSFNPIDPKDLGIIGAIAGLDEQTLKTFETDAWPPDLNTKLYR